MGRPVGSKESKQAKEAKQYSKMMQLYVAGVSMADIGKVLGWPTSTVHKRIKNLREYAPEIDEITKYNQIKPVLFNAAELKLLKFLVDEEKLDKASLQEVAYAFSQISKASKSNSTSSGSNCSIQRYLKVKL